MTLSSLHSQMAFIDLRILVTQEQLTYYTEKQYSMMDITTNLDNAIFGADNNPDGEFGVDMGDFADPDHATALTRDGVNDGNAHVVTTTGGATITANWHTREVSRTGTNAGQTVTSGVPHTDVRQDRRTGEFYAMVGGQRRRVYQTIQRNGQTYHVSGRHIWMTKQQASALLKTKRKQLQKEEYKDSQTVKKLQTHLEMLGKQKDQVMNWLKKRLEDWFKSVADQR